MDLQAVAGSFALVAISEMGDKTQLLAFSLAARFRKPIPIMGGILVATILNHWSGIFRWTVGIESGAGQSHGFHPRGDVHWIWNLDTEAR